MFKKKKLILIVDDNPENRKVLGNLLVDEGYEVGVANDGFQALEFLKNSLPDLVLLDVMMPEMTGFEVCEKMKSNKQQRHIPIIFLTAKTSTDDIVKGFDVGGVDYVQKPFNSRELLARVKTHIELKILQGLLPICAECKCIRNDKGYWDSIEKYIGEHTDSIFSHTICPACQEKLYGNEPWFKKAQE